MKQGIGQVWLSTEAMVVHDNKIWFAEADSNEVYSYDLETKNCSLVCEIAEEPEDGKRLFGTMIVYDDYLYLFPFSARNAYKVNMYTGEVRPIIIDVPQKNFYKNYNPNAKFLSSFLNSGKIYAVGVTYPAIVEYEIESEKISYHSEWLDDMKNYFKNNENALFRKAIMEKNKIYAPSCKGNVILIYDIFTRKYELCQIGDDECCFSSICFDGKNFWLAPFHDGPIISWDEKEYDIYDGFPENFSKDGFIDAFVLKDSIVFLSRKGHMPLKINGNDKRIQKMDLKLQDICCVARHIEQNALVLHTWDGDFLSTCFDNLQTLERFRIARPEGMQKRNGRSLEYIFENRIDTLEGYVCFISKSDKTPVVDKIFSNRGESIWNECIKL